MNAGNLESELLGLFFLFVFFRGNLKKNTML